MQDRMESIMLDHGERLCEHETCVSKLFLLYYDEQTATKGGWGTVG